MAESAEQVSFGHTHAFDLDEPGEFLGSGGFGEVRKVACAGCPEQFARKWIRKNADESSYWERKHSDFRDRELVFLRKLRHPYVVSYIDHMIPTPDGKELVIWTELCQYGDVGQLKRPLAEEFLWHIAEAVGCTLATCHHGLDAVTSESGDDIRFSFNDTHGVIVHRDIKPGNIFLTKRSQRPHHQLTDPRSTKTGIAQWRDDFAVKVGDFGMAVELGEDGAHTFGGTAVFIAPEIVRGKIREIEQSQKKAGERPGLARNGDYNPEKVGREAQPANGKSKAEASAPEKAKRFQVNWTPECDIYSVGLTLMCLALGFDQPPLEKEEHNLEERKKRLSEKLKLARNPLSDVLVKLICQCIDPVPEKRPTALALLAVSLKGSHATKILPRSLSLWTALAHRRDQAGHNIVGRTVYRFTSDYLYHVIPAFTRPEACLIMALISTYLLSGQFAMESSRLLNAGDQLVKGLRGDEASATILHAIAAIPLADKFLRELSWQITKWPLDNSLRQLALREDNQHFRPAMVAALNGDAVAARRLVDIENAVRTEEVELKLAKTVATTRLEMADLGATEVQFVRKFVLNENDTKKWRPSRVSYTSALLTLAAAEGHKNVIPILVDGLAACNVNVAVKVGKNKTTALHAAAAAGRTEAVKVLLGFYTAELLDRRDASDCTPLHLAALNGHKAVVDALLGANIDINAGDIRGKTALYLAASAGNAEVVQLLLKRGADRDLRGGKAQQTPLEVAGERGHNNVVQLFEGKSTATEIGNNIVPVVDRGLRK